MCYASASVGSSLPQRVRVIPYLFGSGERVRRNHHCDSSREPAISLNSLHTNSVSLDGAHKTTKEAAESLVIGRSSRWRPVATPMFATQALIWRDKSRDTIAQDLSRNPRIPPRPAETLLTLAFCARVAQDVLGPTRLRTKPFLLNPYLHEIATNLPRQSPVAPGFDAHKQALSAPLLYALRSNCFLCC